MGQSKSTIERFVEAAKSWDCWEYPASRAQALLDLATSESLPSLRILAREWGWSKSATHRFILQHRQTLRDTFGDSTETEKPKRKKSLAKTPSVSLVQSGDEGGMGFEAPKWLSKKTEPLVSYPDPTDPGHVWMTASEWVQLQAKVGSLECAEYLAQSLESYIKGNLGPDGKPIKKVRYSDHYRTLCIWFARKIDEGKVFSRHPQGGWGFWRAA